MFTKMETIEMCLFVTLYLPVYFSGTFLLSRTLDIWQQQITLTIIPLTFLGVHS
jgi:hypothetical protein